MTEKPQFWWFWGPIYWDFGEKIAKIPDTPSSFFDDFLTILRSGYTGDRTRYTGKMAFFHRKGSKIGYFSHISLCAKFNRFFIILGGVQLDQSYIRENTTCWSTGNRCSTGKGWVSL